MKIILIRYGELTLKGNNRKEFERILFNNIKSQLSEYDLTYTKDRNRIYINLRDHLLFDQVKDVLKIIPGIHNFSVADTCDVDVEKVQKLVLEKFDYSRLKFKIDTKRTDKNFSLMSHEFSRVVGGYVKSNVENSVVDLSHPDQTIYLEIHKQCVYVFHEKYDGMGGLPIGSAGRAVVLLSGGIDSPVSAILAMKRGLKISCLHFSSPPYTNEESLDKVKSLVKILHKYDKDIKFFDAKFSELQLMIHQHCDNRYEVTILRRMMIKYAQKVCKNIKSKVIVTGESLGQVASQTIEGMYVSDNATRNLILRPLITMDKLEIIKYAKQFGTYDISILPYEDCCVIFLPKSPITKPKLEDVLIQEDKVDFDKLLFQVKCDKYKPEDLYVSIVDGIL